ncbi:MAG: hypothetical protein WCI75_09820, partial [candidate division NC10 bacterium]
CHTAHDIRPQWDPHSSVHKERLPETCGQCHPNAGKGMTQGKVHVSPRTGGGIVDWVRGFYIVLIILTLGAMRRERVRLVEEYAETALPSDERVETGELVDILRKAVGLRNGWAMIRARCAPDRQPRRTARI